MQNPFTGNRARQILCLAFLYSDLNVGLQYYAQPTFRFRWTGSALAGPASD